MFLHNKEIEINASSQVREEGKVFCNKEWLEKVKF